MVSFQYLVGHRAVLHDGGNLVDMGVCGEHRQPPRHSGQGRVQREAVRGQKLPAPLSASPARHNPLVFAGVVGEEEGDLGMRESKESRLVGETPGHALS